MERASHGCGSTRECVRNLFAGTNLVKFSEMAKKNGRKRRNDVGIAIEREHSGENSEDRWMLLNFSFKGGWRGIKLVFGYC